MLGPGDAHHFTPVILEALGDVPWPVPVVWNCSGYEKPDTLRLLEGRVQVYLPDLKYALPEPAGLIPLQRTILTGPVLQSWRCSVKRAPTGWRRDN